MNEEQDDFNLFLRNSGKITRVSTENISVIKADKDYVRIYTPKENLIVHCTMKKILTILPPSKFAQIHRSFTVRIDKISEIHGNICVMDDNQRVAMSDSYWKEFESKMTIV